MECALERGALKAGFTHYQQDERTHYDAKDYPCDIWNTDDGQSLQLISSPASLTIYLPKK